MSRLHDIKIGKSVPGRQDMRTSEPGPAPFMKHVEKVPGGCILRCNDPACGHEEFHSCPRIDDCPLVLGTEPGCEN